MDWKSWSIFKSHNPTISHHIPSSPNIQHPHSIIFRSPIWPNYMWKMVEIPFPTTMVSGEPTHLSSLLQGVTERLGFLQAGRMGKDGKMLPWTQYDIMDLENVQETMTLCLQINVVFLKIFLQTKSGNAAFISSIVYATCSWCMKTLASLVWKQEDLSNNDDTLKFARESNSYKHSDIYIYIYFFLILPH